MKLRKTTNTQSSPETKLQSWMYLTLPGIKLCCKVTIIKTVWYWQKNRPMEQTDNPDTNSLIYRQLIFDKGAKKKKKTPKKYSGEKKGILFNEWCWENWKAMCRRMKLDSFLSQSTKINSKRIKDLIIRPETIKYKEKHRSKLLGIGVREVFVN